MRSTVFLFIVLLSGLYLPSSHAQGRWERLGSRTVDWGIDRDVIPVTWRDGAFNAIRIEVRGGALNMHKCIIHFENGSVEEIPLRHTFTRRSASRLIDLPGNKRMIEKIIFWYDTKNFARSKAVVTVWGRH